MALTSTFHMELVNYCFDTRCADIMSSRSGLYPREAFHRLASPQTSFGVRSSRIHFSPTDGFSYERVAQFNLEWTFSKLDSGFQSLVGFRILSAGFRIPKPRIPDSTSKKFLDSGIRIPLHGAKKKSSLDINPFTARARVNNKVLWSFSNLEIYNQDTAGLNLFDSLLKMIG